MKAKVKARVKRVPIAEVYKYPYRFLRIGPVGILGVVPGFQIVMNKKALTFEELVAALKEGRR